MKIFSSDLKEMVSVAATVIGKERDSSLTEGAFVFYDGHLITSDAETLLYYKVKEQGFVPEFLASPVQVSGKEFQQILENPITDTIDMQAKGGKLILHCGKSITRFNSQIVAEAKLNQLKMPTLIWANISEKFKQALFNVDLGATKVPFSGLYISARDGVLVSSDGFQISFSKPDIPLEAGAYFLSSYSVEKLKQLGGIDKIAFSNNQLWFASADERLIVACRLLDATLFPISGFNSAITRVIESAASIKPILLPPSLGDAVRRANVFNEKVNSHAVIDLSIESDRILVLAQRASGDYVEGIACETNVVAPVKFSISSNALLNGLIRAGTLKVIIQEGSPVTLLFAGEIGYIVATMDARNIEVSDTLVLAPASEPQKEETAVEKPPRNQPLREYVIEEEGFKHTPSLYELDE